MLPLCFPLLLGFLAAALISTIINLDSLKSWNQGDPAESFRSLFYPPDLSSAAVAVLLVI